MNNRNTSSRTITYYQDRAKILKASLPSLYGLLVIFPILAYRRSQKRVVKVLSLFAGGLFLLFESIFISSFYRLLFRVPIVTINEKGILYSPGSTWFVTLDMSISWEEIAALYVEELTIRGKKRTRTNRFLAVAPKDEDAFIRREKILSPRRLPLLVVMGITKIPFMVYEQATAPTSSHDLLALISSQYQDKIQENGIEIREEQKTLYESK